MGKLDKVGDASDRDEDQSDRNESQEKARRLAESQSFELVDHQRPIRFVGQKSRIDALDSLGRLGKVGPLESVDQPIKIRDQPIKISDALKAVIDAVEQPERLGPPEIVTLIPVGDLATESYEFRLVRLRAEGDFHERVNKSLTFDEESIRPGAHDTVEDVVEQACDKITDAASDAIETYVTKSPVEGVSAVVTEGLPSTDPAHLGELAENVAAFGEGVHSLVLGDPTDFIVHGVGLGEPVAVLFKSIAELMPIKPLDDAVESVRWGIEIIGTISGNPLCLKLLIMHVVDKGREQVIKEFLGEGRQDGDDNDRALGEPGYVVVGFAPVRGVARHKTVTLAPAQVEERADRDTSLGSAGLSDLAAEDHPPYAAPSGIVGESGRDRDVEIAELSGGNSMLIPDRTRIFIPSGADSEREQREALDRATVQDKSALVAFRVGARDKTMPVGWLDNAQSIALGEGKSGLLGTRRLLASVRLSMPAILTMPTDSANDESVPLASVELHIHDDNRQDGRVSYVFHHLFGDRHVELIVRLSRPEELVRVWPEVDAGLRTGRAWLRANADMQKICLVWSGSEVRWEKAYVITTLRQVVAEASFLVISRAAKAMEYRSSG